jgi:hypothetical protein
MTTTTNRTLAFVIGLALIVSACSIASEAGEETADAVAALEQELAEANRDLARSVTMWRARPPSGGCYPKQCGGPTQMKSNYSILVSDDGTRVASRWEWGGRNFSGNEFDLPYVVIHEYQDGNIVKETIYYASPNAREQLLGSS